MAKAPRKPHIPDLARIAHRFIADAERVTTEQVNKFAEAERTKFVDRIKAQRFEAFKKIPLSWVTLARKAKHGRGNKTMISTRHYIDSIRVYRDTPRGGSKVRIIVGIHPNARPFDIATGRARMQWSLQMVARVQEGLTAQLRFAARATEHGAPRAHVPARPHWGPHFEDMRTRAPRVRKDIARLVRDRWTANIRVRGS